MFKYKNALCFVFLGLGFFVISADAAYTAKTSSQSALQNGTKVRTKTDASGLYDQECYDAYYGCMDQFCIGDNENGGSCSCSDDNAKYEIEFAEIKDILAEASRIATEEVERVKAGADADIIFSGARKYDENGNVIQNIELSAVEKKEQERQSLMDLFNDDGFGGDDEFFTESEESVFDLTGKALHTAAEEICLEQVPASCDSDLLFLRQMYSRQIKSDCVGFENIISAKRNDAELELAAAESDVRAAMRESLEAANEYDRGTCMVEFKKCMLTDDACGKDWENCVSVIASENMQNKETLSTAGTTVANVSTFDITASTMEILNSKRNICENVLDKCVAVRDNVWPDFLREAAPTIKVAELNIESKFRQSCLTNISDCIQNACKDDIVGKGVATMDACLSRPDMARSFCKVQIDPCERMEPLIWGYVTDKLAAMRVDACTAEVKDCFTADTRCGPDFQNCIGMDYDYIHDICPVDSLVVCKANNPAFSMDDLDSMLMGLYLNIDNSALENCQNIVDAKMMEVCGSTTDCNKFAADETIGAGSLQSQKDGTIYRVTGMISFGNIKMGDSSGKMVQTAGGDIVKLDPGEISIDEYLEQINERNASVANASGIISSIEAELQNISGTINRTIEMIEQDPEIQYCINGRDLSQITGKAGAKTTGRFPNLLNTVKMQIAVAALRQAQDNYNAKFNSAVADAAKDASADLAQYMCQKMAETGSGAGMSSVDTPLAPPYAISYEVGAGLTVADLAKGGSGVIQTNGAVFNNDSGWSKGSSLDTGGVSKTTRAVFSRETRICHICTQTSSQDCKTSGGTSWFHNNKKVDCTTNVSEEKCEDIQM